jgi:hypothetical protein
VSKKPTVGSGTPDAHFSGVDAERRIIRQRIDAGQLPASVRTDKCWAGKSSGGQCSGCDELIQPDDNEYEVVMDEGGEPSGSLVFHRRCLDIWLIECQRREQSVSND